MTHHAHVWDDDNVCRQPHSLRSPYCGAERCACISPCDNAARVGVLCEECHADDECRETAWMWRAKDEPAVKPKSPVKPWWHLW